MIHCRSHALRRVHRSLPGSRSKSNICGRNTNTFHSCSPKERLRHGCGYVFLFCGSCGENATRKISKKNPLRITSACRGVMCGARSKCDGVKLVAAQKDKMTDVEILESQTTTSPSQQSSNPTQSSNPVPPEVPLRSQTMSREGAEKAVIELSVTVHPNSPLASFRRRTELPKFPGSYMAWYVMRGICDCWDPNFTDESDNGAWCRKLFLCRLNLIMVPFLAVVDLLVNSLIAFTLLPMIFLCMCYPYRNVVIQRRREEEPFDGCPLHESCDPMVRVFSSFMLVLATPAIIFGIIKPLPIAQLFVRWADGHTVGFAYFEESCLCFLNPCDIRPVQFACGVFFRHRGSGDII